MPYCAAVWEPFSPRTHFGSNISKQTHNLAMSRPTVSYLGRVYGAFIVHSTLSDDERTTDNKMVHYHLVCQTCGIWKFLTKTRLMQKPVLKCRHNTDCTLTQLAYGVTVLPDTKPYLLNKARLYTPTNPPLKHKGTPFLVPRSQVTQVEALLSSTSRSPADANGDFLYLYRESK